MYPDKWLKKVEEIGDKPILAILKEVRVSESGYDPHDPPSISEHWDIEVYNDEAKFKQAVMEEMNQRGYGSGRFKAVRIVPVEIKTEIKTEVKIGL